MNCSYKTFVTVGNALQPFHRFLDMVFSLFPLLPQPVFFQCGHTPIEKNLGTIKNFIAMDEFIHYINQAELILSHAGAGSILHAIKAGKRPIVMPRRQSFNEIINNHQVYFAKLLNEENKIVMVETIDQLSVAIKKNNVMQNSTSLYQEPPALETIKNVLSRTLKNV